MEKKTSWYHLLSLKKIYHSVSISKERELTLSFATPPTGKKKKKKSQNPMRFLNTETI